MHLILEDAGEPGWRLTRSRWRIWPGVFCWDLTSKNSRDCLNMLEHVWLVGGFKPSEKYERQLGWLFPIGGKIKHVPNHQPAGHAWECLNDLQENEFLTHVFWLFSWCRTGGRSEHFQRMSVLHRCHERCVQTKSSWWFQGSNYKKACSKSPTKHVFARYSCTSWANMFCTSKHAANKPSIYNCAWTFLKLWSRMQRTKFYCIDSIADLNPTQLTVH